MTEEIKQDVIQDSVQIIKCVFGCEEVKIRKCFKCGRPFCALHSAKFSPHFCQDCFKSLQVVLEKYTRIVEDYDDTTDTLTTKKETCDRIAIDGPDYIFYTTWINKLNDEELKSVFEFHYFIVKLIEHENETRVVKKRSSLSRRPKGIGLTPSQAIAVTTETETKTKRTAKPKDMRTELRKLGLPESVIETMLKAAEASNP